MRQSSITLKHLLAAGSVLLALPLGAYAMGAGRHANASCPHGEGGQSQHGMRAMLDTLNLSSSQRDALKAARQSAKPAMQAAHKKVHEARAALHGAALAEPFDATQADALAAALGKAEAEAARLRIEQLQQLRALLSPEQRQQLAAMPQQGNAPRRAPASML